MKLNNRGMSLVAAMVAGGIVAGLGLAVAKISQQASRTTTQANNQLDLQSIGAKITKTLSSTEACTTYLDGQIPINEEDINDNTQTPSSLESLTNSDNYQIISLNTDIPGKSYKVKRILFANNAIDGHHLRVEYTKNSNNSYGANGIIKKYQIEITTDSAGSLTECSATGSGDPLIQTSLNILYQSLCEDLGGEYSDNPQKCEKPEPKVKVNEDIYTRTDNQAALSISDKQVCHLIGTGGEDGWKDSSYRHCILEKTGNNKWSLDSRVHEGRSNLCRALCYNMEVVFEEEGTTPINSYRNYTCINTDWISSSTTNCSPSPSCNTPGVQYDTRCCSSKPTSQCGNNTSGDTISDDNNCYSENGAIEICE